MKSLTKCISVFATLMTVSMAQNAAAIEEKVRNQMIDMIAKYDF